MYQWPRHLLYFTTFGTFDLCDLQLCGGSSDHRFCSSFNAGCVIPKIIAFVLGAVFGGGLSLARMTTPSKIVNFLVNTGTWSPSLIFLMGCGSPVAAVGFLILKKLEKLTVFDDVQVPTDCVIDQ